MMTLPVRLNALLSGFLLWPILVVAVSGQDGSEKSLSIASLEAAIAGVEASDGEQIVKDGIIGKYRLAIEDLKIAEAFKTREAKWRQLPKTGRRDLEKQRAALEGEPERSRVMVKAVEQLPAAIEEQRAVVAEQRAELAQITSELFEARGRPLEIGNRLEALQEVEIVDPGAGDGVQDEVGFAARRAESLKMLAEKGMLEQERASNALRVELLDGTRELAERSLQVEIGHLDELEEYATKTWLMEARSLAAQGSEAVLQAEPLAKIDAWVRELRDEVETLAAEIPLLAERLGEADAERDQVAERLENLEQEQAKLEMQAELGGLDGAFAQVLRDQLQRLPNVSAYRQKLANRHSELSGYRLQAFSLSEDLKDQEKWEERLSSNSEPRVQALLEARRALLESGEPNGQRLISELALLDADERRYMAQARQFERFLGEELFWKRSSPTASLRTLTDLPASAGQVFGPQRFMELGPATLRVAKRHPVFTLVVLLVSAWLLVSRRRIAEKIEKGADIVRRISTDNFGVTLKVTLWTLALAVPVPLVIWYLGWAIFRDPMASEWLRGVSRGLAVTGVIAAGYLFMVATCRPHGLGIGHFGWKESSVLEFRRSIFSIMVVFVPAVLILFSTFYEEDSRHLDTVGLVVFVVSHLWVTLVLARLLHPSTGIFAKVIREKPHRLFSRLRHAWYLAAVVAPLALAVLACLGFLLTAQALSLILLTTLGVVAAGVIFYGLVYRWFNVKERKLALEEALERRKARLRKEDPNEKASEEEALLESAESELDLSDVGRQTRRLLRSLVSVGVILAVWFLWSTTMPFEDALSGVQLPGGMNLLGLAKAILILVVTTVGTRNLPGLLELAGLRETGLDAGVRNAISTLAQYAFAGVGLAMLFNVLSLDWSKFGWIAAALSVGLGFGLQEIVANFICGIILLFERPIRIGDVVTVDGVTGTVTRIRMRATTVTNWDRQEFVVPNKNFITGTLLNWTLTNPINRIVIKVGVAYGGDTEKALKIMHEVATSHPRIMEDPSPIVSFEEFGDSSLNLLLRCYLPEMDGRLETITALHGEIDRKFREEGIEIPFPQRDLHLRSLDESIKIG
ncbi:MAG: mechanosensitive ion channel domain-containing protein [Verrucomicrobiota bacterium]